MSDAKRWVIKFVDWYNSKHLHGAIKFSTPSDRRNGYDLKILQKRKEVYKLAKRKNPERLAGDTRDWRAPGVVFLNPTKDEKRHKDKLDNNYNNVNKSKNNKR